MTFKRPKCAILAIVLTGILLLLVPSNVSASPSLIVIRSDGSVDPVSAPITRDGNHYTLDEDSNARIEVEKDDVTLDGNGHMLYGNNESGVHGIYVIDQDRITIQNFVIRYFERGIFFKFTYDSIVRNNTVEHNLADGIYAGDLGMALAGENLTITDNIAKDNDGSGIYLDDYINNKVVGNMIEINGEYGIRVHGPNDGHFIYNNTIRYNADDGIYYHYEGNLNIIRCNSIVDNIGTGIVFNSGWDNQILENDIERNVGGLYFGTYSGMISHDDIIWRNDFIDNINGLGNQAAIHASTYGIDFYNGTEGNYWDDYTGLDGNGDGIGDTAYDIDGTNSDPYPLMARSACTYEEDDETPPYIISIDPPNGATDVNLSTKVVIVFNEEMDVMTTKASFSLKKGGQTIGGGFSWSPDNRTMTFTPDNALDLDTTYNVIVGTGTTDVVGNHLQTESNTTFTTEGPPPDATPPYIISIDPPDGSQNVSLSAIMTVVFSEAMNRSSAEASFNLRNWSTYLDGTFSWSPDGTILTFIPSKTFEPGTRHWMNISNGAKDLAGNEMVDAEQAEFITEVPPPIDDVAPRIISIDPPEGAKNVSIHTKITVTFSEAMDRTTTEAAFSIKLISPVVIGGSISWLGTGQILEFTPAKPFRYHSLYVIFVTADAVDLAGNPLENTTTSDFTTEAKVVDTTPPEIISIDPPDKAENVATSKTITVKFSEAMNSTITEWSFSLTRIDGTHVSRVKGTFTWSKDGTQLTFVPNNGLEAGLEYMIKVKDNATDLAGNGLDKAGLTKFTMVQPPQPPPPPPDGTDWGISYVGESCFWWVALVAVMIMVVHISVRVWQHMTHPYK